MRYAIAFMLWAGLVLAADKPVYFKGHVWNGPGGTPTWTPTPTGTPTSTPTNTPTSTPTR